MLFDGFEVLDIFGPVELFSRLSDLFSLSYVAAQPGRVHSAQGIEVVDTANTPDIVMVPGGMGTRRLVEDRAFLDSLVESRPIWDNSCMESAVVLDADAIRSACARFGVERLRIFGSVLTDRFNPETSDIDFLVSFLPDRDNLFHDYFDLKLELERIVGRRVDLVMERSVKNPFFKASAFESAQEIYAA
ncbi:nucleotidyltransferase domain-containing protein [Brevibacterium spongiae]|uniref:Nucleotidyltransferase domain-containing protein n=1 Tax=Brevibacterium spongiae TaxID=2909672 RepID=A0ABY5SKV9_9MICO|nr:nucleotidyltransferase domain-containing protein [Brevibacterium spongiae]UVI35143.1 nucleotidyltransferase domain-containing protein [Brevibacterium spongiae]